jgi:hypothetical protein
MKISHSLHETDLARTALLPRDEKVVQLRRIRDFVPRYSWSPFRACLPGIYQATKSLLDLPDVTWADVESAITIKCKKHPNWLDGNLQLAKILYEEVKKSKLRSKEWSFGPLPVGYGTTVKFWPEFYCVEHDRPTITYPDPRRGHGLTKLARGFVFSSMHHHIARGDFGDAKFKIATFPVLGDEGRGIRIFEMDPKDVLDIDTLNFAIQETFQLWFEILEEREREARRSARTGTGGLFD